MKTKSMGLLAVTMLLFYGHAMAAGVGYGIVQFDTNEFNWFVILANDSSQSTSGVTSIALDSSSSSSSTPWVWANALYLDGEAAPTVSGLGTSLMTLSGLLPAPADISDLNFWRFRLIPNPSPLPALGFEALLGVTATFTFQDSSTWTGVFRNEVPPISDPYTGGIYMLREVGATAPVPLPAAAWLLLSGLGGLGLLRRRKAH